MTTLPPRVPPSPSSRNSSRSCDGSQACAQRNGPAAISKAPKERPALQAAGSAADLRAGENGQVAASAARAAQFTQGGFGEEVRTTSTTRIDAPRMLPGLAVRRAFLARDEWATLAARLGIANSSPPLRERADIVAATHKALADTSATVASQRQSGVIDPSAAADIDAVCAFTVSFIRSLPKDDVYRRTLAQSLVTTTEAAHGKPDESGKLHNRFLALKNSTPFIKALGSVYGEAAPAILGQANAAGAYANLGEAVGDHAVLSKPSKFTDDEFKAHVVPARGRSATLAKELALVEGDAASALDMLNVFKAGEGGPTPGSQVLSLVRQLVALSGVRSFRSGDGKLDAAQIEAALRENARKGQLNPALVDAVAPLLPSLLVGS